VNEDTPVGQRIAYYRHQRKLSQATLAGRVGRSASWLQKIEYGERPMDSMSMLLALANVLKVALWDLQPKIGLPPDGGAPLDPPKGIHAVRRALVAARPTDREPPTADILSADLQAAKRLDRLGAVEPLAVVLPDLLEDTRASQDPRAIAQACQLAYSLTCTVGELDLALLAADRAIGAAERCGDRLLEAAARRQMARVLMRQGWVHDAGAVCSDAADALAPGGPVAAAVWAMWGSLLLRLAFIAARRQDPATARESLEAAHSAAERAGSQAWESSFGRANVGAHEVAVALELEDPTEALQAAGQVDVAELPVPRRRAMFLVDVAQAYGLREEDGATVNVLLEAERHSPGTVRYSVKAHGLVRACLTREERYRTPELRSLAERLGVTV